MTIFSRVGFVTLIIAHILAPPGDTMEMMPAVLDTKFWLATHVVVITLGYASMFIAGLLATLYIILGVFTPNLTRPMSMLTAAVPDAATDSPAKTDHSHDQTAEPVAAAAERGELGKLLSKMVYGIVCFSTLFSFKGTVLGGIWADQSWGRFWGWDPKENGALIIVLWNGLILHARCGGMVKERGLMNLAIFGNIVTAFSWFGVNMLGIGLHSYGFMDSASWWLMLFYGTQVCLIGLGLIPLRHRASFRTDPSKPPPPPPGESPASPATTWNMARICHEGMVPGG